MVFIEDIMDSITKGEKIKAALKSKLPEKLLLKYIHSGDENDNAVILFTSGSEKDPKGVQLTHKNLLSNIESSLRRMDFSADDVVLGILPFFHVFGQMANLWLSLTAGATIVSYANPLDYKNVCRIIREEKVTVMIATPVFFNGYLRQSESGDFKSVRLAIAGADKTPKFLFDSYKEKHNITIMEGYGATETSPVVSLNSAKYYKQGSIGKPLDNVEVKILDINTGEELPRGEEGRLVVKGDNVMKGYFDDIEETTRRIQNGWYDTGDMGMMDEDGFVWHRGRLKRFVKIAGEMVSLVKVESELTDLLPDTIDCCVVEVPDSLKGAKIIVAVTGEIDEKDMIKKLQTRLPGIAVPKQFVFIKELPKMGSGKVDFRTTTDLVKEILNKER
jgi:acyl-[acyl-carrier-protein]-phospholipid O-acyltransferase/long-chain-fatty-acid--[acyl-carrier-protein] ligase